MPLNNRYVSDATGDGVTAYIVDTGMRATHNEFAGRVGQGYSAISDGNGTNDCQRHGTHVAGTVGGAKYGVAKDVTLVPVRVPNCEGSGTDTQVIAGIDWVTAHADGPSVANMSLGGSPSTALDRAVTRSIDSGVQYALAAGNDGLDACDYSPARTKNATARREAPPAPAGGALLERTAVQLARPARALGADAGRRAMRAWEALRMHGSGPPVRR